MKLNRKKVYYTKNKYSERYLKYEFIGDDWMCLDSEVQVEYLADVLNNTVDFDEVLCDWEEELITEEEYLAQATLHELKK